MPHDYAESNAGNIWTEIGNLEPKLEYVRELASEHGEIPVAEGYLQDAATALDNAKQAVAAWSAARFQELGEQAE